MDARSLMRLVAVFAAVAVTACDTSRDRRQVDKPPIDKPVQEDRIDRKPVREPRKEPPEDLGAPARAERASTDDLGGPERCLTHLSTDKPIYRLGEKVYVRGVILHARTNRPLKANAQANALVEIKGPKGNTVASGRGASRDSVVAFSWNIPEGQPGGEYKVKMSFPWHGYAPAERKFDIRAYRAPRLKSQIVFLRDGYGPGDRGGASLHVERAEGGIPDGAKVTAVARVDGAEAARSMTRLDSAGNCTVFFDLPKEITRGEGTLAMTIEDGGVVETATKTIPILLQTVDLTMYPEGGGLVAGLPNRVYIEAKTPAKKPGDIAGIVLDEQGSTVASFRTEHEGRGRFAFTPRAGGSYTLRITEPSGIKSTYPLPGVKAEGAVIRAARDLTRKGEAVCLRVGATGMKSVTVTLAEKEAELLAARVGVRPGELSDVWLAVPAEASGVLVATLWDDNGRPLAERLIYREPARSLDVAISCDRQRYVPGGKALLTVKTTDRAGKPVSAVVGVTVTDDSVIEMIEKREQAPRLPVMVLLEGEVQELADAHVYLDPANPKAPAALDLLLGTQGWRRFAFVDAPKFIAKHGDAAKRVLALRIVRRPRPTAIRGRGGRWAGAPEPPMPGAPMEEMEELAMADGREIEGKAAARPRPEGKKAKDEKAARERPRRPARRAEMRRALEDASDVAAEEELFGIGVAATPKPRRSDFIPVRVYAHRVRPGRRPSDRIDFTETLYWNAGVRTDARTGIATVSFGLSDSVTTFRVFADGFTQAGALGMGIGGVESVKPFYIEPKLPLEVASGDVVEIPVGVVNATLGPISGVRFEATLDGRPVRTSVAPFNLAGDMRVRRLLGLKFDRELGARELVVSARSGQYSDRVTRKLSVKPLGFPVEFARGGVTRPSASIRHAVDIPGEVVQGSVATEIAVYPTPLANLTDALKRLMREPSGCFEQTSSTTYPLVMAQQYFTTHAGVDPEIIQRSHGLLAKGYKKLAGFECKKKGYEWFGGDPGHEALTAYGLLEFTDMAQVREVDRKMVERTRNWLLARRDGKGGFARNKRALDTFGRAPQDTTNAYILWALAEAGETGLDKEIKTLRSAAGSTKDTYVKALAANVLAAGNGDRAAEELMRALALKQTKDGWVDGAATSVTRSGGRALRIETTSLAVLAWLGHPAFAGNVEKGIRYLAESCQGGRYGSTQSTVLALRAIVAYDKARARPKVPGKVRLYIDGKPSGGWVAFSKDTQGAIELPDIGEVLEPGRHEIELRMQDGSSMPYSLAVNYNNMTPASSEECKVDLRVSLADTSVEEGAVTEANVIVTNLAGEDIPMPVAIIGIPGGLEPRHDQLKELVKAKRIAAYEVIGREVVLYWRGMESGKRVELPISLVAAVPGTYTGPASRAYLYYTDEFKKWVKGVKVTISPRATR